MYYKEKIINGVLCYKLSPLAEWTPLTNKELSKRVIRAGKEVAVLEDKIRTLKEIINH